MTRIPGRSSPSVDLRRVSADNAASRTPSARPEDVALSPTPFKQNVPHPAAAARGALTAM
nr:hypothetical protein [Streptacidiphilus jeojiense]